MSQAEVRKIITEGDNADIWNEAIGKYLEAITKMLYRRAMGEEFTPDPTV